MATYVFQLVLSESKPKVWRRLSLPGRYKLKQVHKVIQLLFGWEDHHLYDFTFGSTRYTDRASAKEGSDDRNQDANMSFEVALGTHTSFLYHYDFGDDWEVVAKLEETFELDRDTPECLDGALAGPPEDCGGIPGFQALRKVLKNPRHPKYETMKKWAPRGYDSDVFGQEAINKKLFRTFGRKISSLKAPLESIISGFPLAKLKPSGAIIACLLEQSPNSVAAIENRLLGLGFPLAKGTESLRRAITQSEAVRVRADETLELVPGPALDCALSKMKYQAGLLFPKIDEAMVDPPVMKGAVSQQELAEAKPFGLFPPQFSLRRKLVLTVDAAGGRATLGESIKALQRLEQRIQPDLAKKTLSTLRGCQALRLTNDELQLDAHSPETESVRQAFRKWLQPYLRKKLKALQSRQLWEEQAASRAVASSLERAAYRQTSKAILAGIWSVDHFALILLDPDNGKSRWFDSAEAASSALRELGLLIGLDPLGALERLGWPQHDKRILDLTPKFKTVALKNGQRHNVSASEVIRMVTGKALADRGKVCQWLDNGQPEKARQALEHEAANLKVYWRFGTIHRKVRRGSGWASVEWNVGKELPLYYAVTWCIEDGRPLRLSLLDGTVGMFEPEGFFSGDDEDGLTIQGRWWGANRTTKLVTGNIIDFDYPYDVSTERMERIFLW